MKILILSSSPRSKGNSDVLCEEVARGATEAGHEVRKMRTAYMKISGCMECYYCHQSGGQCAIPDDMQIIYEAIQEADVIVFGTPIFYYTVCAQLKLVWDRTYCNHDMYKGKTVCLVSACAAPVPEYTTTLLDCFDKYCSCFPGIKKGGTVIGYGTTDKGTIQDNPAMEQAYQLGKNF